MHIAFSPPARTRRSAGLAVSLLIHVLLVAGWQYTRKPPKPDADGPRSEIQWVTIRPPPPVVRPAVPPPVRVAPPPVAAAPRTREAPAAVSAALAAPAAPTAAPVPVPVPDASPAAAAPLSAYEMLQQAKRNVGKIDQDLRKAYPGQPISAPVSNGATRLAKGMQDAADLAPNKWYEAPKVTEIIDPGPYGRRRYRVVGSRGVYCITVESNHAPDGIDQMQKGIQQKTTNCEETEQAATKQDYSKNYNK